MRDPPPLRALPAGRAGDDRCRGRHRPGPGGEAAIRRQGARLRGGGIGDTLILCYHGLSESWPSPSAIPVERLERQLRHVLERGYRGTTFSEAVLSRRRGKTVAVTFDDAYRSIGEQAAPLLSHLGLPGTLFVPTRWVGRDTPMAWRGIERYVGGAHEPELLPMSWAEISLPLGRRLGDRLAHALTPGPDDARGRRAGRRAGGVAGGSRATAGPAAAARSPTRTAIVDARVDRAAERAGYRAGAALPVRVHRQSGRSRGQGWASIANDSDARFRAKASPRLRWLVGSRIGEALLQTAAISRYKRRKLSS